MRLTWEQVERATVGELADMLKAAGPGALADVGNAFRFGFLSTAVIRYLLGLNSEADLRRDLLLVLGDDKREAFEGREAVAKADREEVAAAARKAVR